MEPHGLLGGSYGGLRIIVDDKMLDEDWSEVRSPGRARRRMKRGHKQRIKYSPSMQAVVTGRLGNTTAVMHPAMLERFKAEIKRRNEALP